MLNLFANPNGALPSVTEPVGLVAGKGELPELVAQTIRKRGNPLVIASVQRDSTDSLEADAFRYQRFVMSQTASVLEYFKKNQARALILAGSMPKKDIYRPDFNPDELTQKGLYQSGTRGDARILRAMLMVLKMKGFRVVAPASVLTDHLMPGGVISRRPLTNAETEDVRYGYRIAKEMGRLDIGQTVVVKSKSVLAVEAVEGTDQMIRRLKSLGIQDSVLVKTSKPKQDLRFDMPVIGMETVRLAQDSGCSVIAAESKKTLFLHRGEAVRFADENSISIYGV